MPTRILSAASTAGGSLALQAVGITMASAFYTEVQETLFSLRWAILCIIMLIATDFWSGLAASVKVRGEDFRLSRALRRTIVKFCEYLSFIILGVVLGRSILQPLAICDYGVGGAIGAALVLFIESDSIYGHVCDLYGIKGRFSIKRLIVAYLRRKNEDLGSAVEEALEEDHANRPAETKDDEAKNDEDANPSETPTSSATTDKQDPPQ